MYQRETNRLGPYLTNCSQAFSSAFEGDKNSVRQTKMVITWNENNLGKTLI